MDPTAGNDWLYLFVLTHVEFTIANVLNLYWFYQRWSAYESELILHDRGDIRKLWSMVHLVTGMWEMLHKLTETRGRSEEKMLFKALANLQAVWQATKTFLENILAASEAALDVADAVAQPTEFDIQIIGDHTYAKQSLDDTEKLSGTRR